MYTHKAWHTRHGTQGTTYKDSTGVLCTFTIAVYKYKTLYQAYYITCTGHSIQGTVRCLMLRTQVMTWCTRVFQIVKAVLLLKQGEPHLTTGIHPIAWRQTVILLEDTYLDTLSLIIYFTT